jgi:hypothetical protein
MAAEDRRLAAEAAARADAARLAEEARLRLDAFEAAHESVWAQATAVVNVKAMIPIVLDKATGTYTKWRGMFLTVLGKYALTPHVLDDETLPDRPVWVQVDCVVLSWIFATVSSDLQQSLMICQRRAREAWCYLEDEFLGQKESRALLLETQFRNLRQDSAHLPLQPALLPLLLSDRLLPAVPRLSPAALAAPSTRDRLQSFPSPTRTPCGPVASLALHSPWTDSTSTLCPCRLCPHLFVELCRIPIGAPLCKLSMML